MGAGSVLAWKQRRGAPSRAVAAIAILGTLLAPSLATAAPRIGNLRAYETPYYTLIVTDGIDAGKVAAHIANMEQTLARMLNREVRPTGNPTYIYVVSGPFWSRYLGPGRAFAGEFVPRRFSNYLMLDGGMAQRDRGQLRRRIYHEYTHFFLHTQFRGTHPLWFDEGLAEIMEWAEMRRYGTVLRLPKQRSDDGWIPLPRLFELDKNSPEYLSADSTVRVHRQSWGIVHRGLIADRPFGARILKFLTALDRLDPIEDAARDSFGMSLAELDASMREYLGQKRSEQAFVPVGQRSPPIKLGNGRKLSELEARLTIARAMLDTGLNSEVAREFVESAAELAPGSPEVAVLRLRVAVRDRDDAAIASLLASGPVTDVRFARDAGLALLELVRDNPLDEKLGDAGRAAMTDRALELLRVVPGEEDAEADWAFALAAAQRGRGLEEALDRLERAHTRVPDNPDLAAATALVLEASGAPESMLPWLVSTYRFSADPAQRMWAAERVAELRKMERLTAPE
jgi:hypothetical protein